MLLLSKEDIKKVFTMADAIEADKEAYRVFQEGRGVTPLRTNIPAPAYNGSMLFMPGYIADMECAAVKIVSVFPDNPKQGKPSTPAMVLLVDGTTGEVSAIMDGTYVTEIRTGASSGAAFDVFGRKDAKTGALIGTGGQAPGQLRAMLEGRKLFEVKVAGRNYEKTQAFAARMQEELSDYGTKITAAATADEAVEDADLIITATTSETPVFDGNKVKAGAAVSCVGSYLPNMQEADPALLARADKIFFDSKDAVLAESGDLITPLKQGIIKEEDLNGDIGEVLLGRKTGREREDEIIVFKNVGFSLLDVVTAKRIYDKAVEMHVGTEWN